VNEVFPTPESVQQTVIVLRYQNDVEMKITEV